MWFREYGVHSSGGTGYIVSHYPSMYILDWGISCVYTSGLHCLKSPWDILTSWDLFWHLPLLVREILFSHCLSAVEQVFLLRLFACLVVFPAMPAFLLAVHKSCGVIEGRLSHFLPCWLRMAWQECVQAWKNPLKYFAVARNWTRAKERARI